MEKSTKTTSTTLFTLGGVSALGILFGLGAIAIPAAALLTAAGGAVLVADAVKNPESIKIPQPPEIKVPEIKVPHVHVEYKGRQGQ